MIKLILSLIVLFIASYLLTRATLDIASKKKFFDHPNERSLHTNPTPRIGGIGFVTVINAFLIISLMNNLISHDWGMALIIPPTLLAIVGLFDDIFQLSNKIRFFLQILFVLIVLMLVTSPDINNESSLSFLSLFLSLFAMIWLINLFNFMDGIDGIAGMEAIFLLLSLSILVSFHILTEPWHFVIGLTAVPISSFLILNWQPAKIFMGDVGSTYLGLLIGTFILISIELGVSIWSILILLGVFMCDASWTLLTRIMTRQKWFAPHRTHAYQKLAVRYSSHSKVTFYASLINLFWLFPLALAANIYRGAGMLLAIIAYVPLLMICRKVRAGALPPDIESNS